MGKHGTERGEKQPPRPMPSLPSGRVEVVRKPSRPVRRGSAWDPEPDPLLARKRPLRSTR